jgi:hypothetical protein
MNLEDFNKYKDMFEGFTNINDVTKLANLLNLSDINKIMIINYYNTLNLGKSISYDDFIKILSSLNKLKYKEDILEHLFKLSFKTTDRAQINTILRILKTKENRPYYFTIKDVKVKNKFGLFKKNCPHCAHENIINDDTNYVICGYNNIYEGYDWEGCGQDWCAKCGKRLCKKWNDNLLFLEENRYHNSDCCLIHSKKNDLNYYSDYCQCIDLYVNRNS